MIPTKIGAVYAIAYIGPYDYTHYAGPAVYNGELDGFEDLEGTFEQWYGFDVPNVEDTCFFAEQDIIGELKN